MAFTRTMGLEHVVVIIYCVLFTTPGCHTLKCLFGSSISLDEAKEVDCVNGSCGTQSKYGFRTFACIRWSLGTCNTYHPEQETYTFCCDGDFCNTAEATDSWAEAVSVACRNVSIDALCASMCLFVFFLLTAN